MSEPARRPVRAALALLGLPLLELWVVHALVGERFGPNNTRIGFYARDVLLPGFLGAMFYLSYLLREGAIRGNFRRGYGACNALFLGATLFLLGRFDAVAGFLRYEAAVALLIVGTVAALVTAFFCFLDPRELVRALRAEGPRVLYAVAAFGLLGVYARIVDIAWRPLASMTGRGVCLLLRSVGVDGVSMYIFSGGNLQLHHTRFTVRMASGCAGIEGVFFFLFFYGLVRAKENNVAPGLRREVITVALGVVLLFLLNVFRIFGMVASGIRFSALTSREAANTSVEWLIHNQVSWVLYVTAILAFFAARRRLRPIGSAATDIRAQRTP